MGSSADRRVPDVDDADFLADSAISHRLGGGERRWIQWSSDEFWNSLRTGRRIHHPRIKNRFILPLAHSVPLLRKRQRHERRSNDHVSSPPSRPRYDRTVSTKTEEFEIGDSERKTSSIEIHRGPRESIKSSDIDLDPSDEYRHLSHHPLRSSSLDNPSEFPLLPSIGSPPRFPPFSRIDRTDCSSCTLPCRFSSIVCIPRIILPALPFFDKIISSFLHILFTIYYAITPSHARIT